ncbi:MAG TPA: peptidase T [Pirellulaceae bacterium]|nr:peptidase T [Pirellulaceae bacterium]
MNRTRLLERFLRYVRTATTADDSTDVYPSSPGQLELGRILVDEAQRMGYAAAHQDEHGLVWIEIGSNRGDALPRIAFNAHLDTSPETSGTDVRPHVIDAYDGSDLVLAGDPTKVIRVAENPELRTVIGKTIVTTDGTTLLGGDDKAGVAILMELAETLAERPELPHGPITILFTCDEEIGRGVKHVDFAKLGATACYTLDGGGADIVDVETFSADLAIVKVRGVNIHPSIGKGRMVNALRVAGAFLSELPIELSPERTEGREGFLHPYVIDGGVAEVTIRILLREFDTPKLAERADLLREIGSRVESLHPGSSIAIEVRQQYRNLADGLAKEPRAVGHAIEAHRRLGRTARKEIIRGGTDGSVMTEKGLPTPNLSSGQHNLHSPLEWACLDEMIAAGEVCLKLAEVWSEG